MIIRNITLSNIRSYKSPAPIPLTTGVTLFEGDIGSGKSTILSAIEFALFGLGDVDSSYLLRHGERTGSVLLEFEVSGKQYKAFRSLERKKTSISQKEGYIVEQGVRTDYSVTEMKTRVLEILNFNECARPKTSSLIYRYAIFTPQEMMKEVLSQPVERRLETLRRAFRIEDYSVIVNNASVLISWLEGESKILDRQTQDIGEKRLLLKQETKKKQAFITALEKIIVECNDMKETSGKISKQIEELQTKKENVQKLAIEIPSIEKELKGKNDQLNENKSRAEKLTKQLKEISDAEKLLITLVPTYEEYKSKKAQLDKLEPSIQEIQELTTKKSQLEIAIKSEKKHLEKRVSETQKEVSEETERISKQKEATAKIPELMETEKLLSKEVEELPTISELLSSLYQEHATMKQDVKSKKERSKDLNAELDELRKIGIGAPCPKCKQELTKHHYSKVEQDYLTVLSDLKDQIAELNGKIEVTNAKTIETSKKEKALKGQEQQLNSLKQELAKLKQQEKAVKEQEEVLTNKQRLLEESLNLLNSELFGQDEKERLSKIVGELENLDPVKKEFETLKERIKAIEKTKIEEQYLTNKSRTENKQTVYGDLEHYKKQAEVLIGELKDGFKLLELKKTEYNKEKPVLETIKDFEKQKEDCDQKRSKRNEELVGTKKDVKRSEEEITRIEGEIQTRENQLLKFHELKQYQIWFSEFFIPAIKLIETNVLANINSEFNLLFQKWLGHLLETGDISVRVDDNFTPIIEQNGYEMDVNSLSGGEKTSVALAYRLALNVMVKKVCEAMQSNLLILDEPTDGFSREQLFRLRDILKELNCEQVIFVSHESELEGFVDKIYRITKEAGESKITVS
jgi:DNA repair protein SbcC/Rad50